MAWPTEVYVATSRNGVYHTTTFTPPDVATQPTWAAVNDGLANTLVKQFALDPFNQAGRQYCLLTNGTLYQRTSGGAWASILTAAEAQTECGIATGQPTAFCCDTNAAGTLYVLHTGGLTDDDPYVLKSTDYGVTWSAGKCYASNLGKTDHVGGMRAHDPYVWIGWNGRSKAQGILIFSSDSGATWSATSLGVSSWAPYICGMPAGTPNVCYLLNCPAASNTIYRYEIGVGGADLQTTPWPTRPDVIWFSPTDADHMRMYFHDATTPRVYTTTDGWTTIDTNSALSLGGTGASLTGADRSNDDALLVGMRTYGNPLYGETAHVVHAYDAEDGTVTAKAGSSPGSAPYSGSIPSNSGAVAWDGVQPVFGTPGTWQVYSCRYEEAS